MKKFLLSLMAVLTLGFVPAMADGYQEKLVVTINGESTDSIPANITVDHETDGTITFSLKNFMLVAGEDVMPVGNIVLKGVKVEKENGYEAISTNQNILIEAGQVDSIAKDEWLGPMLGEVPIALKGKVKADRLYVNIDIDMMSTLQQVINVVVGQDKGFEPSVPEATVVRTDNYAEKLVVTINEESTDSIPANIVVQHMSDSTVTFSLKNFKLVAGEDEMPVGNIVLKGVKVEQKDGYEAISTNQSIFIEAGDDPAVDKSEWLGPMLGEVPIALQGKVKPEKLYVNIGIDMMSTLQQIIKVAVGQDKGFEVPKAVIDSTNYYADKLVVSINEVSTDSIPANISVDYMSDGTVTFSLKNFMLVADEGVIPVGNIVLSGIKLGEGEGYQTISTTQTIRIEAGQSDSIATEEWLGPLLGEVPIVLNGKLRKNALYVNIDIDMMSTLQQIIKVVVGSEKAVTGIADVVAPATPARTSGVYTLSGIRVADSLSAKLPKGVYVVNGKKVIK